MAELTTRQRKNIPAKDFALPEKRAYPVEDKAHARNAKARAAQQRKAGNLTAAEETRIDARADRVLGKSAARGRTVSRSRSRSHPGS